MAQIDRDACEFALNAIGDGFVFEKFAAEFVAAVMGYAFMPVGGLKDRGIDGLEHIFCQKGFERNVYQTSIESNPRGKLEDTLKKLADNKVEYDQLYFVTSREFKDKDKAVDELYAQYKKPIHIRDAGWFSANVNNYPGASNAYNTFVESHLHEFQKPGKAYTVDNHVSDPRLFVFLRQQWDEARGDLRIDTILADTLILYALEGTDPDKGIFRTKDQIFEAIAKHIKFDAKLLLPTVEKRLGVLSNPAHRQIQFHKKQDAYCLPFEVRRAIQERNLRDAGLHSQFKQQIETRLKTFLKDAALKVKDCLGLIETTIHKVFYRQGLEFADFVLKGENKEAIDKYLPDIVSEAVDQSGVIPANKEAVKSAMLMTIRDMVYNGSAEEKEFLSRLSHTYMMLFVLHCDPKVAGFFATMANNLQVYVCTSIIIPAMSEVFLDEEQRRYWNLLKGARAAGVRLLINQTILDELVTHFKKIKSIYEKYVQSEEYLYEDDESRAFLLQEILLRVYFYAKGKGKIQGFSQFVDTFLSPSLQNPHEELIEWLKTEFGIEYVSDQSLGVIIDKDEEAKLVNELIESKKNEGKAKNDANLILAIFALRAKNNESGKTGIFGYRTWWLSSDSLTHRAVNKVFGQKYSISCYIRPDFLYNYISLAPLRPHVDDAYKGLFPTLVGVNLSVHLPKDVLDIVHANLAEHRTKNPARVQSIMRGLVDQLKTVPPQKSRLLVTNFFNEQKKFLDG